MDAVDGGGGGEVTHRAHPSLPPSLCDAPIVFPSASRVQPGKCTEGNSERQRREGLYPLGRLPSVGWSMFCRVALSAKL